MSKELMKRLYYFSTFDGCLHMRKDAQNASFVMNMLATNQDYLELVKKTLEELEIGCSLKERLDYNKDGFVRKPQLRLESKRHPKLTTIWQRIYMDGHKIIDPHLLTMMDAESLAIIYMADGSYHVDKRCDATPIFRLNTKGFSYGDNWLLKKTLKEKLDLEFNVHKQNNYFYLSLRAKDSERFQLLVSPYILPSFQYKLGRQALSEMKDGDIVCSASQDAELGGNDLTLLQEE